MHHSDNRSGAGVCQRCGTSYQRDTSAWDLCFVCLELELSKMSPKELGDVPGAVLKLFNLEPEYFRE